MAVYDAGEARGTYTLDAAPFERTIARVKQQYAELARLAAGVGAGAPARSTAPASIIDPRATIAQQRLATETQKTVIAQNQAARAAQQLATEEQRTAAAVSNAAAAQTRAEAAALRLAKAQTQATGSGRSFAASAQGINSALTTIGVSVGIGALVRFGTEAGQAALELDHTQRVTKAIAGDQAVYNKIVAEARAQQVLFGGTLQSNIDGLAGLAVTSKNTGASLAQLVDIQKRLTVLNPAQGATGGLIALNEALAGNISSLQRRFNIPRSELQKLSDTAAPVADRLQVLDTFLNKVGITSAAVSESVGAQAQAYNQFSAEVDNAKVALGGLLASLGKVPAEVVTTYVLKYVTTGLGTLASADAQLRGFSARAIEVSTSFAQYGERVAFVNSQLRPYGASIGAVTEQQFTYARSLIQSGVSADEALTKLQDYSAVVQAGSLANTDFGRTAKQSVDDLIALAETSDGNRQAIQNLSDAYLAGNITAGTFGAAIAVLSQQQVLAASRAHDEEREQRRLSASFVDAAAAAQEAATKSLIDADAKALEADKTKLLQQQAQNAANAFLLANPQITESGIRSAVAAGLIPALTGQLAILTQQIRDTQAALANAQAGTPAQGGDAINRFLTGQQKAAAFTDIQAREAKKARDQQVLALGTDKQKLAVLQQQADTARRLFGAQSAQAIEAETKLSQEKARQEKADDRAGRVRISAGEKALNLEERIRDSKEAQLKASLDAAELAIRDRQERRKEDREIAQAQRILASGRAAPEFKAAAQDRLALIEIQRQQRQLDLQQKQATAGGAIIGGRIFQARPGTPGAPAPTAPAFVPPGQLPAAPTAPGRAAPGQGEVITLRLVDTAGRIIAEAVAPFLVANMRAGLQQANAGGGRGG